MTLTPFHLAIPVRDAREAEAFYTETFGCEVGRKSDHWVDLNLFGHQLVCHEAPLPESYGNPVDGDEVPVPHFGVVLTMDVWQALADRLTSMGMEFVIEPRIRFQGLPGEQATMFFQDPSGNALEFKAFADIETELFKTD
jgi:extradiol dioxygenase family protein